MEDVKLSILSAAKIRFSRFGFQKTTINEICRDCRISKRTLYQQFPNKEELFMCLITHELEKLKAMLFLSISYHNYCKLSVFIFMKTGLYYLQL